MLPAQLHAVSAVQSQPRSTGQNPFCRGFQIASMRSLLGRSSRNLSQQLALWVRTTGLQLYLIALLVAPLFRLTATVAYQLVPPAL